ncbi:MAG: hypothetical protein AAFP86_04690, partial [Planctomycetota bacterium]
LSQAAIDVGLRAGSPSIDAADPNAPLDPDGTRADMGARPFDPRAAYGGGTFCPSSGAEVALVGTPSLGGAPPARFVASALPPGRFGLLVLGSGVERRPITASSSLCVGGAIVRLPVRTVAADGTFEQDLDSAEIAATGAQPGGFVHLQLYYRASSTAAALSTAIEARVDP